MSDAAEGAVAVLSGNRWIAALLVTVIGGFMAILDSSIVNVAIPKIMTVFGMTTDQVQWVVTIYLLTLGVVVPTSAWLGDRYGYKQIYIVSLAAFTVGSMLSGIAWSGPVLIGFRVLQALGGGMIMPVMTAMVFRMVPRDRLGSAMGILGVAIIMAPAIGPTIGGYLVQYVDWRLIFYINVPIGIIGVLLARRVLPEFERHPVGPFDWPGFLTSAGGLFALLYGLSQGPTLGWTSEQILVLLYVAAVLLTFFVFWELRVEHPLLDMRVFKYLEFSLSNVLVITTTIALFSGIFYIPLFLQNVAGMGAFETGLILMPAALVTGALMPISGRLYDRIGARPLAIVGLIVVAWSTYLLHNLAVNTPNTTIIGWLVLRSVGMGIMMMPVQTVGLSVIPTRQVGYASAISNIIQRVAGSFGIAYLTAYMSHQMAAHQTALSAAVSPANPGVMQMVGGLSRLAAAAVGPSGAQVVANEYLAGLVAQRSFVSAVDDIFSLTAIVLLVGIIPALFLRYHKSQGMMPGMGGE